MSTFGVSKPELLLFDLDGTLVDTARDLYAAADRLCVEEGVNAPPYEAFRQRVSQGGTAMLSLAFPQADAARISELLPRFLRLYDAAIAGHSGLFPGFDRVLEALAARRLPWGVVSNKPERLAQRVMDALDLSSACVILIGGDTLPQRKPDPAPLLEACRRTGHTPNTAWYVGDDPRDVQAAQAAGMPVAAAAWGYVGEGVDPLDWNADRVLASPLELLTLLDEGL